MADSGSIRMPVARRHSSRALGGSANVNLKNIDLRMRYKTAVCALVGLLLCIAGCDKPVAVDESLLVGAWKYPYGAVLTLATNHTYSQKEPDGRTTLGQWRLEGSYLTQIWTNVSGTTRIKVTNQYLIADLTYSRMVLQNGLGDRGATLTRIPAH